MVVLVSQVVLFGNISDFIKKQNERKLFFFLRGFDLDFPFKNVPPDFLRRFIVLDFLKINT